MGVGRDWSRPGRRRADRVLCDEIRSWAPEWNQHTPSLIVYPADTPDSELAGPAIDKTHSRFVLTYDPAG
jgi:protein-L-isoaspartate(D-aspartate) O-methyltransferase